jgi:hypothetical protein
VARVVRLMLFKNYDKPDVPVKRQELNDVIQAGGKARIACVRSLACRGRMSPLAFLLQSAAAVLAAHRQQARPAQRAHWAVAQTHSWLRAAALRALIVASPVCLGALVVRSGGWCAIATTYGQSPCLDIRAFLKHDDVSRFCCCLLPHAERCHTPGGPWWQQAARGGAAAGCCQAGGHLWPGAARDQARCWGSSTSTRGSSSSRRWWVACDLHALSAHAEAVAVCKYATAVVRVSHPCS